jgi:GT2 family glycosyltransferase
MAISTSDRTGGPERMPFVSVIIPHLNQPGFLDRCLTALAGQSYGGDRFEVIVVDNGSHELPQWASERGATLLREAVPGPGPARNRGVAASRGEVLAFIDADCLAAPDWLRAMVAALLAAGEGAIVGGDVRVGCADPARLTLIEAYETVFAFRQREYIEKKGFSGAGNLMVWRRDYDRIGPFAGIEVAEDRVWGRQAGALGYRVVYAADAVVTHPARASLDEIAEKWRRQTDHDHAEWRAAGRSTAAWCARALAVALSPLPDLRRILRSERMSGARNRALAAIALVRIRLWRAARMLRVAAASTDASGAHAWNR